MYAARIAPEIYGGGAAAPREVGAALLHGATRAGPKRGYYSGWPR